MTKNSLFRTARLGRATGI